MNAPSLPSALSTMSPMRVMIFMFTTTYGESEISTPMWEIVEPTGPMLNGMTYIVRPRMQPSNFGLRRAFILSGAIQLLVGPASSWSTEQMNVRSSTRATSLGWLRARKQPGRFSWLSLINVPLATISSHSRRYSSSEPLHQYTWSGLQSFAISSTQATSFLCFTVAAASAVWAGTSNLLGAGRVHRAPKPGDPNAVVYSSMRRG